MTLPTPQPVRTITREELMRLYPAPEPARPEELAALHRLVAVAQGDTGQSRPVADLLLAWWNAADCGGFDLTDLWGLDADLRSDCLTLIGLVARLHHYPDAYGLGEPFRALVAQWRKEPA